MGTYISSLGLVLMLPWPQQDSNKIVSYWQVGNGTAARQGAGGEAWWQWAFWQKLVKVTFERIHLRKADQETPPWVGGGVKKTSGPPGAKTPRSTVHRVWWEQRPWWVWHLKCNHFFGGDMPQVIGNDIMTPRGPARAQEIPSVGLPKPLTLSRLPWNSSKITLLLEKLLCTVQDLGTISYSVTSCYNVRKWCNNNQASHRSELVTSVEWWPVCNRECQLSTRLEASEHGRPGQAGPSVRREVSSSRRQWWTLGFILRTPASAIMCK